MYIIEITKSESARFLTTLGDLIHIQVHIPLKNFSLKRKSTISNTTNGNFYLLLYTKYVLMDLTSSLMVLSSIFAHVLIHLLCYFYIWLHGRPKPGVSDNAGVEFSRSP